MKLSGSLAIDLAMDDAAAAADDDDDSKNGERRTFLPRVHTRTAEDSKSHEKLAHTLNVPVINSYHFFHHISFTFSKTLL
jgi:hypothetical protein